MVATTKSLTFHTPQAFHPLGHARFCSGWPDGAAATIAELARRAATMFRNCIMALCGRRIKNLLRFVLGDWSLRDNKGLRNRYGLDFDRWIFELARLLLLNMRIVPVYIDKGKSVCYIQNMSH